MKELIRHLTANHFFPAYAPAVTNYGHKMRGMDGNNKPIKFTQKDKRLIAKGLQQLARDITRRETPKRKYSPYVRKVGDSFRIRRSSLPEDRLPELLEHCTRVMAVASPEAVYTRTRKREVIAAKHLAFFLLTVDYGWGCTFVGKKFGRNHASVLNGIRRVQNAVDTKQDIWEQLCAVREAMAAKAAVAA